MIQHRALTCSLLLVSLLGLSACNSSPIAAVSSSMSASLSGANEVPATNTNGNGAFSGSLDKQSLMLSWTVTYTGLSGPATGGHIHGPAMTGQNAGVVIPFNGSLESPIRGMAQLTAAQVDDLRDGKWYVNLHTAANPGGEIRGQVSVYR
jgi:hypothetical protein